MRNLTHDSGEISQEDRSRLLRQKSCVIWLTGLSGSGKSTIARNLEANLFESGNLCYVLDGDNVRRGLNSDLGFSDEDRKENIRRIAEVSVLLVDSGIITIVAFISPFRADRVHARNTVGKQRFIEVYLDVPLEICEKRDPKKLYQKARKGEILEFTGISSDYEIPENPEIALDTSKLSVDECVGTVIDYLKKKQFISKSG